MTLCLVAVPGTGVGVCACTCVHVYMDANFSLDLRGTNATQYLKIPHTIPPNLAINQARPALLNMLNLETVMTM